MTANFAGGPNFRDAPEELSAIEGYGAYNCTFDERGGVASRLGFVKRNGLPLTSTAFAQTVLFYAPKLYWRLGDAVGSSSAADASGNGNAGTVGSGVTLGESGAPISDTDTAALLNNTSNAYVATSTYTPYASGAKRTFVGWANRSATTDEDTLFGGSATGELPGPPPAYCSIASGSEDVVFHSSSASSVTWTSAWPGTSQWVFFALTYDDTTKIAELFVNGVSKGQKTLSGGYAGNSRFYAGMDLYGHVGSVTYIPFNGYLDEIAVYESTLTAAQIAAIYASRLVAPGGSSIVINDYYSRLLGSQLTQVGVNLYLADNTTAVHTFTTTDCVTFAELNSLVIAAHPVDGIWYSSDGNTWTKVTDADAPTKPLCVTTWQARLYVGLADGSVHWSDPGDPTAWTGTSFNEIWTKDQQPIIALHVGSGQDIIGKPGLLVFKQDSVYRINDPATGAYTVVDATNGAAGPKAVVGVGSRVCWIGKHGIFWWREDQASPVNASDLLRPIWRSDQLSFANQKNWCAGRRLNRAYFSCSSINSNVNDIAIEFHPDEGWVAPRSDAVTCYSTATGTNETTYGGSPTVAGQVYQLDTGGTDDGAAISWWYQTRWVVPNGGYQAQVWQLRLLGRGTGTLTVRTDNATSGGTATPFNFATSGVNYDNGISYDDGTDTYAVVLLAETEAISGIGACRQFSLLFSGTSSTTVAGRALFGSAPSSTVGAFGLYSANYLFVPLGTS